MIQVFLLRNNQIIRIFDIFFSFFGLLLLSPLIFLLLILGLLDTGSPLFFQERIGQNEKSFILVKLRTMEKDTISLPTHLSHTSSVTRYGKFLRKTKLDELPQLWNVLKGEMSLVGPRPGLLNQIELIKARRKLQVFAVRPGITGLSQINNIDMSKPETLAATDAKMLIDLNLRNYFKYILMTFLGNGFGDPIGNK